MLAVFDVPLVPNHFQQALRPGLLGPKTGQLVGDFFGVFDDLATPDLIDLALQAEQLCGASQAQGLRLDGANPQRPLFNATVALVDRLSRRGEKNPSRVVGPWPKRAVDCL